MRLLLAILVPLLVPFTILKWRFVGAWLSVAADASDVVLFDAPGGLSYGGGVYHTVDKFFDTYYLSFMFYVSLSWTEPLERRASAVLSFWRPFAGFFFLITQTRPMMFFL